ncbi:hypothetical protein N0V94_006352 [Neodidymelliopsis sp. IMI 364377]|nr:hypothetical protein N0V94_006352 [Neodidymelliopsis sp. IMI 364377]
MFAQLRSLSIFRKSHDYTSLNPLPIARSRTGVKIAVVVFPVCQLPYHFRFDCVHQANNIYIHTDFNEAEIRNASSRGDWWTRVVINTFPEILIWIKVDIPTVIISGEYQHVSDFVRWDAIPKIGGVYLDWNVIPLRPLTPLLNADFAFVCGRQYNNTDGERLENSMFNDAAFMTKPNSTMTNIIAGKQHTWLNNSRQTNLRFMTTVAEQLVSIPNEVLILDRTAFAPIPESQNSTNKLFMPNPGAPSPEPIYANTTDPIELYKNTLLNRQRRADWEMDFSSAYMLHGTSMEKYHDWINPETILSRTSNFGVAMYDIVRWMQEDGLVSGDEDGKGLLGPFNEIGSDLGGTPDLLFSPSSATSPTSEKGVSNEEMEASF